jgi:hypothetical protein
MVKLTACKGEIRNTCTIVKKCEGNTPGDPDTEWSMVLKWILKKWGLKVWTRFKRFRLGASVSLM